MIYLKKLSLSDGAEIYNMLQEIGKNENGFHNKIYGVSYDEYENWLRREFAIDNGELEDWMVPQTSYWLYDNEKPIGYGRVRHYLNDALQKTSGHIGYAIRRSERGQGYGNLILSLLLDECKKLGIEDVQISANTDNIPSNRVIIKNGGMLIRTESNKNFYIVRLV